MSMDEAPRVALVTGGARGIGRAIVEALFDQRYSLCVADVDDEGALDTSRTFDPNGDRVIAKGVDVTSTVQVNSAVTATVEAFGRLDALVNCAGTIDPQPSQEVPDENWTRLLDVHLNGAFRFCRAAYPHLAAAGSGAIVSISSVSAQQGIPKRLSYSAAKGAIEAMTRVLAIEWAPAGIRVNAVGPGYTMTKRMEGTIASGLLDESSVTRLIPLRRFAKPSEIASVVAFLLSEKASYVTGQTFYVDGGVLANSNWQNQ